MNIYPYSNFHDLNLDWLLEAVKQLRTDVDGLIGSATPSNTTPQMDGAGAPGVSVNYSRGDHQHPTDTSRASATALANEVTARTNKDLSLDGDIAAVDAKIHFSASNPLMDGSATAGFSTDQARADHIHPTDTSRAAAADLTQEISDRSNADITLQNNINAVDAKIVLATGAPLMDSSSATPGSSTSMARADHVHPTDTSRASATDLATLTARVDSFTGSAIASDATPQMNGVGSAGTGGNYSRGDHVHPSDTSKVNKSGDTITGDLKIDGALVPLHELQYLHVNSIGWIRIADVPNVYGTWAKFAIVRRGDVAPSEIHIIDLCINQFGITFEAENSIGDVLYVNKIRYSNAGKVDIHMDQTDASDIGVRLIAVGPTENGTKNIKLIPFRGVAPAPGGETILKNYTFVIKTNDSEDCVKDSGFSSNTFYLTGYRQGDMLYYYYNIAIPALTANTDVTMGAFSRLIPPQARYDIICGQFGSHFLLQFNTNGSVVISTSSSTPAQFIRGSFTVSAK